MQRFGGNSGVLVCSCKSLFLISICDTGDVSEEDEKRPANAPLVDWRLCRSAEVSSERRCMSKGRGSVYDPVFGICCHFCRSISTLSLSFSIFPLVMRVASGLCKIQPSISYYFLSQVKLACSYFSICCGSCFNEKMKKTCTLFQNLSIFYSD